MVTADFLVENLQICPHFENYFIDVRKVCPTILWAEYHHHVYRPLPRIQMHEGLEIKKFQWFLYLTGHANFILQYYRPQYCTLVSS